MQGDFHIGDRLIQPRINSIQFEGETIRLEPKVMQGPYLFYLRTRVRSSPENRFVTPSGAMSSLAMTC